MARRDLSGAVDFDYLESYAGGDLGLVEEVLGIFEQQCELWLRLLDPAGDPSVYRDGAHTMKGAAAGVGARGLAEACGAAEAGAADDAGVRSVRLETIKTELSAVLADISAWRHEQALRSLKGEGPI